MPSMAEIYDISDDDLLETIASIEDGVGEVDSVSDEGCSTIHYETNTTDTPPYDSNTEDNETTPSLLSEPEENNAFRTIGVESTFIQVSEQKFLQHHFRRPYKRKEWYKLELHDFCIYKEGCKSKRPESLHSVATFNLRSNSPYLCAGTLKHEDGSSLEVRDLRIVGFSIDKLCESMKDAQPNTVSCRDHISIQTHTSRGLNVYYYLATPKTSYEPCFSAFGWLSDLLKHISDYLLWAAGIGKSIYLKDLKAHFVGTLLQWHGGNMIFRRWHDRCGRVTDFRRHLLCADHASFIYNQLYMVADGPDDPILLHPLWNEINQPPTCIGQKNITGSEQKTLVTPHARRCFIRQFPLWGSKSGRGYDILRTVNLSQEVAKLQVRRQRALGLGEKLKHRDRSHFEQHGQKTHSYASLLLEKASHPANRRPLVHLDEELLGKAVVLRVPESSPPTYQFAWVYSVRHGMLKVRWLALPEQTLCRGILKDPAAQRQSLYYPIGNEVFFTSQCSCDKIHIRSTLAVYSINVGSDYAADGADLFVRHIYDSTDQSMAVFRQDKLKNCPAHSQACMNETASTQQTDVSGEEFRQAKVCSIFSASGQFDSGVMVGSDGIFETIFAADIDHTALLSCRANHPNSHKCHFKQADVNLLLQKIADGELTLEEFDLLIAGTPCLGFTVLNILRQQKGGQRNCSLLAHALSWVEILVPKMVLLENVPDMDPGILNKPSAAGQTVAFLVSLGYQVKLTKIVASDVGAATTRARLFVIATVPDIPLPKIPSVIGPTNASPKTTKEVSAELNVITNDTMLNPAFPDHTPFTRLSDTEHTVVSRIPTKIPKKGRMQALSAIKMISPSERIWYSQNFNVQQRAVTSNSFRRTHPNRPYGTIVTTFNPKCRSMGTKLHWVQNRLLSFEELRRFHGVPELYLLIGSKGDQLRQVGNSVSFPVGVSLGQVLKMSWRKSKFSRKDTDALNSDDELSVAEASDSDTSVLMDMYGLRASLPPASYDDSEIDDLSQETLAQHDNGLPDLEALITPTRCRIQAIDTNLDELSDLHDIFATPEKPQQRHPRLYRTSGSSNKPISHSTFPTKSSPSARMSKADTTTPLTRRKRPFDSDRNTNNDESDSDSSPSKRLRRSACDRSRITKQNRRILAFQGLTVPTRIVRREEVWTYMAEEEIGM